MLGRYKTQGNYRYKAFDEYRYGHGALLALGHIRAGECIVMEHLLMSCVTGTSAHKNEDEYRYWHTSIHCALLALGHIRASECIVMEHLLISCATGSGHIRMKMNTGYGHCALLARGSHKSR